MSQTLRIAVVGHTNTGKTSLLRTLARDAGFGEVADRPGTTRQVQGIALLVDGLPVAEFLDTPGLEDSIGLLETLDAIRSDRRLDGPAQLAAFFASEPSQGRFAPEASALRAVLACDAAIYVVDARDRVLPKHRDELEILARCGRPIVPVLNFVDGAGVATGGAVPSEPAAAVEPPRTAEWREVLARVNLHAVVEFDAVVFDEAGEIRLFEKLQTLLDRHRAALQRLIDDRRRRGELLRRRAANLVAGLLVEAATAVEVVDRAEPGAADAAEARMRDRVRGLERRCAADLLTLFGFKPQDCISAELPLVDGEWGIDLFSPAAMRRHGLGAGGGAAAGAAAGLGLDLAVGGMSLGAATALGAAFGGVLGALGLSGGRLVRRVRGGNEVRPGDATLRLLLARQLELVRALLRRGHAAVRPVKVGGGSEGGEGRAAGLGAGGSVGSGGSGEATPTSRPRGDERTLSTVLRLLREELPPGPSEGALGGLAGGFGGLGGRGSGGGGTGSGSGSGAGSGRGGGASGGAGGALGGGLVGGLAGAALSPRELVHRRIAATIEEAL